MKRVLILLPLCLLAAACGNSKSAAPTTSAAAQPKPAATTTAAQSPNALQGEAKAAATGVIPDNQVYVVFSDPRAGHSIKYPEGWAQSGSGNRVTASEPTSSCQWSWNAVQRRNPSAVSSIGAILLAQFSLTRPQ